MATTDKANSKKTNWMTQSLQGRLFLASIFCLPLFVGASGFLLDRAFQENLRSAEEEQLKTQFYVLLGAAEWQDEGLTLPNRLADPRFSTVTSGLYGQINQADTILWRSSSTQLMETALPVDSQPHQMARQYFSEVDNLFRFCYDLLWEDNEGVEHPLRFQLFHSRDQFSAGLKKYRQQLGYSLGPLALGLLLLQLLIMRWGLRPLSKLAKEIKLLPHSDDHQLQGEYPAEIEPVTESLNQVLHSEQAQRERYKNTLGDLAHSLKTPLSIIQGERRGDESKVIDEQLERMNNIIRHQLQRAVIQSRHQLHKKQAIKPVVDRLCTAMSKVYRDKNLSFTVQIADSLSYAIESQDLFELLGNLIENACKYGNQKVWIEGRDLKDGLKITVADDGEGISAQDQESILQRGARIDTAKPGQGLGLSISTDIISAYDGSLSVNNHPELKGACFVITLPH